MRERLWSLLRQHSAKVSMLALALGVGFALQDVVFATNNTDVMARSRLQSALYGVCTIDDGPSFRPLQQLASTDFLETFDGDPTAPLAFSSPNWDLTIHSRGTSDVLEAMAAQHGADCGAPPNTHEITRFEDAIFNCKNHVMTAINASDYGLIYMTPNRMLDFSNGEAILRFDMSTLRTSKRDWVDVWVSPFEDESQLALDDWLPDLQGLPRRAIHIRMDDTNGDTMFRVQVINNFSEELVPNWNGWTGYETVLTPDAARRDTFELRVSRTHIKFGMPQYNLWWADTAIPDLGWDQGVVQLGHHSYNPKKEDGCGSICQPNTWHWDNIFLSPARPFTMIKADRRTIDLKANPNGVVTFAAPAPKNAFLRFTGYGLNMEVTFDGGKTWQAARKQASAQNHDDHYYAYFTPIPEGAQRVSFRAGEYANWGIRVNDLTIWSKDGGSVAVPTTLPPTAIATNVPATATPTRIPTVRPTNLPPTNVPTEEVPTDVPTARPTRIRTQVPTAEVTDIPTEQPTVDVTDEPTVEVTDEPTVQPTPEATDEPNETPTEVNDTPTERPTSVPSPRPSQTPNRFFTLIYDQDIADGWEDRSWNTTVESLPSFLRSHGSVLAITYQQAWAGFYLQNVGAPLQVDDSTLINLRLNGGATGGQRVRLVLKDSKGQLYPGTPFTLLPNRWRNITLAVHNLGPIDSIQSIYVQEIAGTEQPTFYIDRILFLRTP